MKMQDGMEEAEIERQVELGTKRVGLNYYGTDPGRARRFDGVEGCCRDCEHALIRTRKYDDSPRVTCCVTAMVVPVEDPALAVGDALNPGDVGGATIIQIAPWPGKPWVLALTSTGALYRLTLTESGNVVTVQSIRIGLKGVFNG